MASLTVHNLFGGAITAVMPANLINAADIRQVPDTQEVFIYPESDISVIIEILQMVDVPQFNEAIRFHFDALAHDNSANKTTIDTVSVIPNDRGDDTPSAITLSGTQYVSKFNKSTRDEVLIFMVLYRVKQKAIDIVATFNVPMRSNGGQIRDEDLNTARSHFDSFVRSLRIIDYGLFA